MTKETQGERGAVRAAQYEPCQSCPWRKSSTVGGADIPGFSIQMMRNLSNTVGNGDAFRPIMACHYSPVGKESACKGYIAREGYSNINVRMLASKGKIPIREITTACERLDLWPSFGPMLKAYERVMKGKPRSG